MIHLGGRPCIISLSLVYCATGKTNKYVNLMCVGPCIIVIVEE